MSRCKSCEFCIKSVEFHKCDMDGEAILNPEYEGKCCVWYKEKRESWFKRFWNRNTNNN